MSGLTFRPELRDLPIASCVGRLYNPVPMFITGTYRTFCSAGLSVALLAGGQSALGNSPSPAPSAPSTQPADVRGLGPREVVEQTATEAIAILTKKNLAPAARDEQLRKLMRERMDLTTLAHLTVGNAWQNFTPRQQEGFTDQFGDHLLGLYTPLAFLYAGQQVQVDEVHPESNGDQTVIVHATDRKGEAGSVRQVATITGRMRKGAAGWRAIDITIEGVSIAQTFRSQFQPVVAKSGIDALIEILRQKNAQARSGK